MIIKNNNVIIPLKMWNELKKIDYFNELIEVIEDSRELEQAKLKSKTFVNIDDYIRERKAKYKAVKNSYRKPIKVKKSNV